MIPFSTSAGALILGAGLFFGASPLAAQAPAAPASCPPEVVSVDTVVDTLFGWLPQRLQGESEAQFTYRAAQERIALGLVDVPPMLGRRDGPSTWNAESPAGGDHLVDAEALVWFQLYGTGRLSGMKLERRSGWSRLDVALQRAVVRADSMGSFDAAPASLGGAPLDFWVAAGFLRLPNAGNVPLARVTRTLTRYQGDVIQPRLLDYDRRRFPDIATRAGAEPRITFVFEVDTTGRVVPGSIRPAQGGWRPFTVEAARVLRTARFAPGRIGRCFVPQRVTVPFSLIVR